jgi:hypothetical protein
MSSLSSQGLLGRGQQKSEVDSNNIIQLSRETDFVSSPMGFFNGVYCGLFENAIKSYSSTIRNIGHY